MRTFANSLRGRYLGVSILVGALTVVSAGIAGWYVASTTESGTRNIALRHEVLEENRAIRNALREAEFALHTYALLPSPETRVQVHERLHEAITRTERMLALEWVRQNGLAAELVALREDLSRLDEHAARLIAVREDPDALFPAIGYARASMLPAQRDFYSAVAAAVHERASDTDEAVRLLSETRYVWSQMISAFRLYLVNRLASFAEAELELQAQDVEVLYQVVSANLARLQALDDQGVLGVEGSEALGRMHAVARRWEADFRAIGMLFIVLGFKHFERLVLRPITQVVHALKREAMGEEKIELPAVTSLETQDLIDAFSEMRRQVRYRQQELEYQALHDSLTKLPNRTLLQDRLHNSIMRANRDGASVALLIMDLDRFKEINDTLGHQIGDGLLQQVGQRLQQTLRESDTVARLGGDEFAVLLAGANEEEARQIARKILGALEQPFKVAHHTLYVGSSIGIATYPRHGTDVQSLVQRADVAMYLAKRRASGFAVYSVTQDQYSVSRLALVNELRSAIAADELSLHFQPKLDLRTNAVVGVEALLRWDHPRRGNIPPDQIIPVAEQTGLIKPLTLWVMDRAMQEAARWRQLGLELSVAVNLSVWNLHDPELDRQVREKLEQWQLPNECLAFEITESGMMTESRPGPGDAHAPSGVGSEADRGRFRHRLLLPGLSQDPVHELKIDKSFVLDMTRDENDAVIVRSTIELAHNLGLQVVAEGVENKEALDVLLILGCDTVQGYHLSRPLPAEEFLAWVRQRVLAELT